MPARDKQRLTNLCGQLKLRPLELLPELKAMQDRYPNVPAISNYIGIAYDPPVTDRLGDEIFYKEVNKLKKRWAKRI